MESSTVTANFLRSKLNLKLANIAESLKSGFSNSSQSQLKEDMERMKELLKVSSDLDKVKELNVCNAASFRELF